MIQSADRMNTLPFSGIRVMMEKANQMQKQGQDVIHMEIGRPDFDTPEVIKQAAYESLRKGNVFYTSNYGTPELRAAIAKKLREENDLSYQAEEILVTVGVSEGTYAAIAAFLNPGEEILVPDPVWLNYFHVPNFFGGTPVSYTLKEERNYQIDPDQIESLITDRTRILVINTPGNPTGAVQTRETLEAVAEIAKKHDLLVISDEIYEKLIYGETKHVSIASLPGMKERTITLNGFSKCYSMTGWRLGYIAAPKEMISVLVRAHMYAITCAASFAQEAAITALEKAEPDVQAMVAEYQRRRDYAVKAINAIPGLSCREPGGAFYLFVNVKTLDRPDSDIAQYFLEEAKVATVPGSTFGPGGEGYIRISYACAYDRIVEGLDRIRRAVEKLQNA